MLHTYDIDDARLFISGKIYDDAKYVSDVVSIQMSGNDDVAVVDTLCCRHEALLIR